ncbi:MAG TPA: acetate/propionate family kinase [Caulifigura sp.]|nr:acetate/propionate family kinase [Caulifigura sp.]
MLTINSGSSSLKFSLMTSDGEPRTVFSGVIERIGQSGARMRARAVNGGPAIDDAIEAADHAAAIDRLRKWLETTIGWSAISAVGHRIVHGGSEYIDSCVIDDDVVAGLRRLIPLAPSHLPGEIAAVEALRQLDPGVPQVCCFDTAFHRDLPAVARCLTLPRHYESRGMRRYGFHGLSYDYLMGELERQAGREAAQQRVILAHLGAGCSMAAVRNGTCIETTMGFTPTAGLMMATRTGDLDPGVMIHLMREERLSADDMESLFTKQSGLLGASETSADVRDLLEREGTDSRAAEALEMFCYHARGWIGRLAAALNGLDTLVFSAGIGENSAVIRSRICAGLEWLGIRLDGAANQRGATLITRPDSQVAVRVIRTNEELMIFREVTRLLSKSSRDIGG